MTGARQDRRELTAVEREVAVALGRGEKVSVIARMRGCSDPAVSKAISNACNRLGIYGRKQLAEYARKQGWCS